MENESAIYMNHGEVIEMREMPAGVNSGTFFIVKFLLRHGSGLDEEIASSILGKHVVFTMYEGASEKEEARVWSS